MAIDAVPKGWHTRASIIPAAPPAVERVRRRPYSGDSLMSTELTDEVRRRRRGLLPVRLDIFRRHGRCNARNKGGITSDPPRSRGEPPVGFSDSAQVFVVVSKPTD